MTAALGSGRQQTHLMLHQWLCSRWRKTDVSEVSGMRKLLLVVEQVLDGLHIIVLAQVQPIFAAGAVFVEEPPRS